MIAWTGRAERGYGTNSPTRSLRASETPIRHSKTIRGTMSAVAGRPPRMRWPSSPRSTRVPRRRDARARAVPRANLDADARSKSSTRGSQRPNRSRQAARRPTPDGWTDRVPFRFVFREFFLGFSRQFVGPTGQVVHVYKARFQLSMIVHHGIVLGLTGKLVIQRLERQPRDPFQVIVTDGHARIREQQLDQPSTRLCTPSMSRSLRAPPQKTRFWRVDKRLVCRMRVQHSLRKSLTSPGLH